MAIKGKKAAATAEPKASAIGLAVFAQVTAKVEADGSPKDGAYFGEGGLVIPRTNVITVVGKTIYYRKLELLGNIQEVTTKNDVVIYITDAGPVIAINPAELHIGETLGGPAAAEAANDEDDSDSDSSDNDDEDDDEPAPKKRGKKVVEEEEDEDDEPAPKKRGKKVVEEEDEDDEPAPKKRGKKVVEEEDDNDDDDSSDNDDDDDDDEPAPKKRGKKVVEDDDDDEPAPKKRGSSKASRSDDDDDEEMF